MTDAPYCIFAAGGTVKYKQHGNMNSSRNAKSKEGSKVRIQKIKNYASNNLRKAETGRNMRLEKLTY